MNSILKRLVLTTIAVCCTILFCLNGKCCASQISVSMKTCSLVIRSMELDNRNRLWIGTFGRGLWVKDANRISQFHDSTRNLPYPMINNLIAHKNHLYIATAGGGIHCLNTDSDQFLDIEQNSDFLKLHALMVTASGTVVAGSVGSGTCVLKKQAWVPIAPSQSFSVSWVNALVQWNGNIWLGTSTGLYRNPAITSDWSPEFAGLNRGINHLAIFNKKLYIGTTSRGVFVCDTDTSPVSLKDTSGNVHFLIEYKGNLFSIGESDIFKISSSTVKLINTNFDNSKCATIDGEGNLLIGTLDGKIFKSHNGKDFSLYMALSEKGFEVMENEAD